MIKGITTHKTISEKDLNKIMTITIDEIDLLSPIKVEIVSNKKEVYKKMVDSIANLIKNNNKKRKKTKLIYPVICTPHFKLLGDRVVSEPIYASL